MRKTDWKDFLGLSIWMFAVTVVVARLVNASTHTEEDASRVAVVMISIGVFVCFLALVVFCIRKIQADTKHINDKFAQKDEIIDRQLWRIRTQDAAMKRFARVLRRANAPDVPETERKAIDSELQFLESLIRTEEHHP